MFQEMKQDNNTSNIQNWVVFVPALFSCYIKRPLIVMLVQQSQHRNHCFLKTLCCPSLPLFLSWLHVSPAHPPA